MDLALRLRKLMLCLALSMLLLNIVIILYQAFRLYTVEHNAPSTKSHILQPVKVFQIGFSKCGTKALADLFNNSGVPSVHHDGGHLAISMYNNYLQGAPLLAEVYQPFYGFFDMERLYDEPLISIPKMLFKELDKQYPGSKFILNTRDKQKWLYSKAMHPAYHHKMRWLDLHAKFLNKSKDEVLAIWSQEWDEHYAAVLEYFKDRPQDLLVFNIEKDSPKKICAFFKQYFDLNPKFYRHTNKSVDRDRETIIDY